MDAYLHLGRAGMGQQLQGGEPQVTVAEELQSAHIKPDYR